MDNYYIFVKSNSGSLFFYSYFSDTQLLPIFTSDFNRARFFLSLSECMAFVEDHLIGYGLDIHYMATDF